MTHAPKTVTTPLGTAAELPDEMTLALAVERLAHASEPLFLVRRGAETRALLEVELRQAVHGGRSPDTIVWELAHGALLARTEAAALTLLGSLPALPAVVVLPGSGTPALCVARVVAPVRQAVVMAGGLGERLRPLTLHTPKPLLQIAGEPLLARILRHLRAHGIEQVFLSVNYLSEQIRRFVGDGSAWRLSVHYLEEQQPLGTGAGLVQMPHIDEPFLVINGDVLTDANLSAMMRQHVLRDCLGTVATCRFAAPLPYGVVHGDTERIVRIEEKPVLRYPINAGIYVFSSRVLRLVPPGQPLSMVPFLNQLIDQGHAIERFPLVEYWNDIGAPVDYERAQRFA